MHNTQRQRIHAVGRVSAKTVNTSRASRSIEPGVSTINELYQQGSARIRFPNTEPGALQAVLLNTAGGLTGDDHIQWHAEACAGAHLSLSTAACEKIYRTHGPAAIQHTSINVEDKARVEWLPQESILFNGSHLQRKLDVQLNAQASALICESLVFGRQAMDEPVNNIRIRDRWRIHRSGRLLHAEDLHLDINPDFDAQKQCILHHYSAISTLVMVCDRPDEWFHSMVARIRSSSCPVIDHVRVGASVLPSRLVVRVLASDSFQLRKFLIPCIELLNDGRDLPTVWKV